MALVFLATLVTLSGVTGLGVLASLASWGLR
jgi:hypothetical protein